jgi:phosphohistidine phosphatase SixA/SAM-dependent methyltransferase
VTRRLYLLRKCKTDAHGGLDDQHDRMARALASHMQTHGVKPSIVLCSSIRRNTEVLKLLAPALDKDVRIVKNKQIQKATNHEFLAYLQSIDENVESVMLIVRRRDLERISMQLTGGSRKTKTYFDTDLPPLGLAILEFCCSRWQELEPRNGQLAYVYRNLQNEHLSNDYFKYYDGKQNYKHSFEKYFSAKYVVSMFEAVWGVSPPYTLLDAGSANGMTLSAFARKNIDAWGIENSPYIHRQTRRKWRSRNILGDIRELPFADKRFDFTYESCLCYVAECDVDRAIRELSRVTRQGLFFGSIVRDMGNGTDEDWEDTFYGVKALLDLQQWSRRFLANGFRTAIESRRVSNKVWNIEKQANNDDPWYPDRGSMRYCFYTPC